jgi:serine/threonine protein kinase
LARYRLPADFEREEDENEGDWKTSVIEGEKIVQEKASTEIKMLSLAKGLKHIISIEGITFEGSRPCFLMPYYERGNLQQAINKGNLTTHQKYQIALDLLHGLKQCQIKKKIFIGDIKPENVLLDEELRAVIIDFETALITDDDDDFRKDIYNLFYCVFALLFNEKDGKYYAYVQKLLSIYDCHSFPSIATTLMLWENVVGEH